MMIISEKEYSDELNVKWNRFEKLKLGTTWLLTYRETYMIFNMKQSQNINIFL